MPAQLLGAHMPAPGGIHNAILGGHAIGCTAVQVFTSSPQMWKAAPVTPEKVAVFKSSLKETGIEVVVSHDSYLVNLCAPNPEIRAKSLDGLKGELNRCHAYGIRWAVSHVGASMGEDREEAKKKAAEGIREVLADTPDDVMLLMETTAGQGSALNFIFDELAFFLEALKGHPRLGVCLDTCHIFAAGYDIRTAETYASTFNAFESKVGFKNLKAVHANDSKKGLGSKVDRHAHIGEGEIGEGAFRLMVNDSRFEHVPILLETPEAETMHAVNLERLKSMRAQ
jgi:deoxyribonuclease IV